MTFKCAICGTPFTELETRDRRSISTVCIEGETEFLIHGHCRELYLYTSYSAGAWEALPDGPLKTLIRKKAEEGTDLIFERVERPSHLKRDP